MGLNALLTSESTWLRKGVMCNDHNDTNMDSGGQGTMTITRLLASDVLRDGKCLCQVMKTSSRKASIQEEIYYSACS